MRFAESFLGLALSTFACCAHTQPSTPNAAQPTAAPIADVTPPAAEHATRDAPREPLSVAQPAPTPIVPAPIEGEWWLIASRADSAGNAVVYYVDAQANVYELLRSPERLLPPGRDDRSLSRILPDLQVAGAAMRLSDGVIEHWTENHDRGHLQCRYVPPCALECAPTQGSSPVNAPMRYDIAPDGRVESAIDGRPVGPTNAAFVPPPSSSAQCQARMLMLASVLYDAVDRQYEPQ